MLVLTRKVGEQIWIRTEYGRIIKIEPRDIRKNQVRLGFEASRAIQIDREEVFRDKMPDQTSHTRDAIPVIGPNQEHICDIRPDSPWTLREAALYAAGRHQLLDCAGVEIDRDEETVQEAVANGADTLPMVMQGGA